MQIKNIINSIDDPSDTNGNRTNPALTVKDDNTVFICYGKRITRSGDIEGGDENQIWFLKSNDGGATFTTPTLAIDTLGVGEGSDDPQLLYNNSTGRLHLFATTNVGLAVGESPFTTPAPFVWVYSDDEGATWSSPSLQNSPYQRQLVSTGSGIEVGGRIVAPIYCASSPTAFLQPVMFYSDDDGASWNYSPLISTGGEYGGENKVIYDGSEYYVFTRRFSSENGYRFCYKSQDLINWSRDNSRSSTIPEVSVAFGLWHKDGITYHSDQAPDIRVHDLENSRYGMAIRKSKDIFKTEPKKIGILQRAVANQYAFTGYSVLVAASTVGYILYEGSVDSDPGLYRALNLIKFSLSEV